MTGSSGMWNGEGWFTKGNVGCQDWEKGKETLGQQKKKKTDSTTKIFEEFYYILRYWMRYIFFLKIISTIWTLEHQEYYMYPELKGGHRGGS